MDQKEFKLIIELLCPGCSNENCSNHLPKKIVIDKNSGLEFEVICVCKDH